MTAEFERSICGNAWPVQAVFPPPNRRIGTIDVFGLIGLGGLLIARYVPIAVMVPFWGCTFRKVTGYPCPGCGLTRAADRFSHFNVIGALKANPLGTVAACFFAWCAVATLIHLVFKVPLPELSLSEREWRLVRWAALILFAANYLFVIYAHRVLHFT
jgi:hypothetical protein